MDRDRERLRQLRARLAKPNSLAAVIAGRAVICVSKTVARRLVSDRVMRSGLLAMTKDGRLVLMLRPEESEPTVAVAPEGGWGANFRLQWTSPGGLMGLLPGGENEGQE